VRGKKTHRSILDLHRTQSVSPSLTIHLSFALRQLLHAFCTVSDCLDYRKRVLTCFFSLTRTEGATLSADPDSGFDCLDVDCRLALAVALALALPFPFCVSRDNSWGLFFLLSFPIPSPLTRSSIGPWCRGPCPCPCPCPLDS
jgi:hypothetical protein